MRTRKQDASLMRKNGHNRKFRFSGHESFVCRYAWLPKAIDILCRNAKVFADENEAMVLFGVGKNMVRSIRFWAEASGIMESHGQEGAFPTEFGQQVLGKNGHDPYLENVETLWLIHWKLSTQDREPLFAWHYLLNQWHEPEMTRSAVLASSRAELQSLDKPPSDTTLSRQLDTFFHSYVPTRGKKGLVKEDNLDCPLAELALLRRIGDRQVALDSGRREPIYALNRESKPEISAGLFAYCLNDFFVRIHPSESTLSFREVSVGYASPRQVFKLPETDIRDRLELIERDTQGLFVYQESASIQQVQRMRDESERVLLKRVYSSRS